MGFSLVMEYMIFLGPPNLSDQPMFRRDEFIDKVVVMARISMSNTSMHHTSIIFCSAS